MTDSYPEYWDHPWHRHVEGSLKEFLISMSEESRGDVQLNLEDYLQAASKTVGSSFSLWSCLMGLVPAEEAEKLNEMVPEIEKSLHQLSVLLRIANDIRGYEREREEGKTNCVAIWINAYDVPCERAKQELWRRVDIEVTQLNDLIKNLPAEIHGAIKRAGEFVVKLYRGRDFH